MRSIAARWRCAAVLGVAAGLTAATPAAADNVVAELAGDTPIAAYGGAVAWSAYDVASKRYALTIREAGRTAVAPIRTSQRAFDISLGPDERGRVVALYTRCATASRHCDVYRYDVRARRESKLRSVSSPAFDEAWPVQWRGRIAFVRRARTRVIGYFDSRPDPKGRGPLLDCDVPYVKTLASRAASRRLDRSQCGPTVGMAIRGETIVQVTDIHPGGAGSESQVRRLRARGGAAVILARAGGGEDGYSPFGSPSLSKSAVWLTRSGAREGVRPGFVRIGLRSRRLTSVPANLNLGGRIARDERDRFWYIQRPQPFLELRDGAPFCVPELEPCRLVRASASPFSATARTLLPRLDLDGTGFQNLPATTPPVVAGGLTRAVVRGGSVLRREPVSGVGVELLRLADSGATVPLAAPGLTATTHAAGRFAFVLAKPPPALELRAFAAGLRVASEGMRITTFATIAIAASGTTLTGTVAPAQPGRSVAIERLAVDAQGKLPDGRQLCVGTPSSQTCADSAFTAVGSAPLGTGGTAFSFTAPGPGVYRARLSSEPDGRGAPTAYGGASPDVRVGP